MTREEIGKRCELKNEKDILIEKLQAENERLRNKRRYEIASRAMQGLRASKLMGEGLNGYGVIWSSRDIAKQAVSDADALIAELDKGKEVDSE